MPTETILDVRPVYTIFVEQDGDRSQWRNCGTLDGPGGFPDHCRSYCGESGHYTRLGANRIRFESTALDPVTQRPETIVEFHAVKQ